jgi:thiol:disulfide interchange protein DsbA
MSMRVLVLLLASLGGSLASVSAPAQNGLQAGRDYERIEPAAATAVASGMIEVVEVFGYSCGACAALQPHIDAWKPSLPADVAFRYQPAAFGGVWDLYARAYFAAEALGVLDAAHAPVLTAVHTERRPVNSVEDIAGLFAEHGADAQEFLAAMNAMSTQAKLARAKQTVQSYGSTGTPELIINGRYRIGARQAGSHARMLEIANQLIEHERAATATP